ncbi:DMT family transporter [Cohaesibacter sp. ES.047]|uniref:DMT family transporter n=1 Tax=Cohaesibacter sp. ES.047 TaxID=1798205 RepID=UPI000BB6839C|nr:DMT family transporter [Cohaesibacter sp. ES.047]
MLNHASAKNGIPKESELHALGIIAGACHGGYLVLTKKASRAGNPLQTLCFQCAVGTLLLSPQAFFTFELPPVKTIWLFAVMGGFSALAHFMTIKAFQYVDASTLSSLVYLELVGAVIFGLFVFRDIPDIPTILGALLIAASGFILQRYHSMMERRALSASQGLG